LVDSSIDTFRDLFTGFENKPKPILITIIDMKYLLRDGLEIGMPAGTRSNHSASLSLIPNQFISTSSQRGECCRLTN